jgi:hypothetical protein
MGLFHKKEKVPEIPLASNVPELPEVSRSVSSELPSLPKGLGEQANRAMVKSAVNDLDLPQEVEDENGIQELSKDFKFEESVLQPPTDLIPSLPKQEAKPVSVNNSDVSMSNDPIFVKIEKFQIAKKELQEINKNIKSVEAVLGKLNEIKSREDKEVTQISESLSSIKTKLASIDSNVFKKA